MIGREDLTRWIERYEDAWRASGTDLLPDLFAPDATYRYAPFEDPIEGLDAISEFWDAERAGPDEAFTLRFEIVAVEGDTGVARLEVVYSAPEQRTYRDLWIVTLDDDGRCTAYEEWPFFPSQDRIAPDDPA